MNSLIKNKYKIMTIILIQFYILGLIISSFSLPIKCSITYTHMQWSIPELISKPNQRCYQPNIVADNSSKIYVAWPGSRDDFQYNTYINMRTIETNSSSWTDVQDISSGPGITIPMDMFSMIHDQKKYLHLCWLTGMGDLCYRYGNDLGWSNRVIVSTTSQYDLFSFGIFSDGSIIFVWSKLVDSTTQLFSRCFNPLYYNWSSIHQITYTQYNSLKPIITIDSNDLVHLIWLEEFEYLSNASVYYKSFNKSFEFSNESKISDQCNTKTDARIIVDNFDNLHAVWEEKDGYTFKLVYRKQVNDTWLSKIFINPYYADNPAIYCDSNNVTHFIWYEGNNLRYRTINQNSYLSEIESATQFCGGTHPEITVDTYGNVHVVYLADPTEYTLASPPTEFGINYIVKKEVTLTAEPTTIALAIPFEVFIIIYVLFSVIVITKKKSKKN